MENLIEKRTPKPGHVNQPASQMRLIGNVTETPLEESRARNRFRYRFRFAFQSNQFDPVSTPLFHVQRLIVVDTISFSKDYKIL